MYALRSQLNQAQDDNNALSEQIYLKSQEVNKLTITLQNAELISEELTQKDIELSKLRAELFNARTNCSTL